MWRVSVSVFVGSRGAACRPAALQVRPSAHAQPHHVHRDQRNVIARKAVAHLFCRSFSLLLAVHGRLRTHTCRIPAYIIEACTWSHCACPTHLPPLKTAESLQSCAVDEALQDAPTTVRLSSPLLYSVVWFYTARMRPSASSLLPFRFLSSPLMPRRGGAQCGRRRLVARATRSLPPHPRTCACAQTTLFTLSCHQPNFKHAPTAKKKFTGFVGVPLPLPSPPPPRLHTGNSHNARTRT